MGQSESSDDVPGTPAAIVEQNNIELLTFLFLLLLTLVVLSLLSIAVIFVFFPSVAKHNPNCIPVTTTAMATAQAPNVQPKQASFDSFGSWIHRIRTTAPLKGPQPKTVTN